MKEQANKLYSPKFKDVVDYVSQKYPERLNRAKEQEYDRKMQREAVKDEETVRRRKNMNILLHEEKDIELCSLEIDESPPEMDKE